MRLLLVLVAVSLLSWASPAPSIEIVQVAKIWDQSPHSAFGDLIHFNKSWIAVFREGAGHVATAKNPNNDGKIRVISSSDGKAWTPIALIEEPGVDLRDPHISETSDHQLMIVAGGSVYREGKYVGRRPRVMFSTDGSKWSNAQAVLEEGMWLWRVTWFQDKAWGVAKFGSPSANIEGNPRRAVLFSSSDGIRWDRVSELPVTGADETTVRFLADGTLVAFIRRVWDDGNLAAIGKSSPPYTHWDVSLGKESIGGPNFIVLPDGRMVAGGRFFRGGYGKDPRMSLGWMTTAGYSPLLELPSGGDTSYPGFAWQDGFLWTLYYSSHEGKTAIYLAKLLITGD